MYLIIVESPTKSKTIKKFLPPNYQVEATLGHIRDLPEKTLGIDIENNFQPNYVIIPKRKPTIKYLKEKAKRAEKIVLATDPDREGEAIAWHLLKVLNSNLKDYQRVVFHEITKPAIEQSLTHPRKIDFNLVNAQQARRILDRLVGYKLSPFLWEKISRGLSAGRVQSVALRLIVEREREIQNFKPQEYWTIEALLKKSQNHNKSEFRAILTKKGGEIIPKLGIKKKEEAEKIVKELEPAIFQVIKIEKKEIKKNPLPPFITSTLQQEVWQKLKFPAQKTMTLAQQLYEKGLTTYHRTDSLNLAQLALKEAQKFIEKEFGKSFYQFRKYKTKSKLAQEAHEAIRPTYPAKIPQEIKIKAKLEENQFRLYDLIWRRFIASQMTQAIFEGTKVEIEAKSSLRTKNYLFKASGQVLKFEGFLKVYPIQFEKTSLPSLVEGEILELKKLLTLQHFTQPPSRYTEATLIKTLEKEGIGRPSTYAPILETIQKRNYVRKNEKKQFQPTEIGILVNDILVKHFSKIVDLHFTAQMEEDLDEIAKGKEDWITILKKFYLPFEKNLIKKQKEISKQDLIEKTEKNCPKCHSPLIKRWSRYGKFLACSRFPKCNYHEPLFQKSLKIKCPKCQKGELVERRTKKGKIFYGCEKFPDCDFALWEKPLNKLCPKCHSILVETKEKKIKCSNKECS